MPERTYRIARSCFGPWESDDGRNRLWEKIAKLYPPNERGVSIVPQEFKVDNVTIDCKNGSIFCLKPLGSEPIEMILFKREKS